MVVMSFLSLFASVLLLQPTISASVRGPSGGPSCSRVGLGAGQPEYACTDSSDWRGDGYSNKDCMAVIQRFFYVEVSQHDHQEFEFVTPGTKNKTGNHIMKTPRRYHVGQLIFK